VDEEGQNDDFTESAECGAAFNEGQYLFCSLQLTATGVNDL